MGPDELIRISYAAKRYFVDSRSRIEISEELEVSRFKVARMLQIARERGIVRIEIVAPKSIDMDLSIALRAKFGLKRALAIITPGESPQAIQESLGRAAAELLEEIVVEGDFLGFTAGRTLEATTRQLTTLPYCDLVALGGVAGPEKEHGVEIIRRVSQVSGGTAYPIFAPLFVTSPITAQALRTDRLIADAYARFARVTIGVVAVGSWAPPDSQLYDAVENAGLADDLVSQGVVAEVCATLFDADGGIIHSLEDRSIAITAEQLRAIPEVIAVAGGQLKTTAILAALRSGIVNSLVTDAALAQRLLEVG